MLEEAIVLVDGRIDESEPLTSEEERVFIVACQNYMLCGLDMVANYDDNLCDDCESGLTSGNHPVVPVIIMEKRFLENACYRISNQVDRMIESLPPSSRTLAILYCILATAELIIYELSSGIEADDHLSMCLDACRIAKFYTGYMPGYDPIRIYIIRTLAIVLFEYLGEEDEARAVAEDAFKAAEDELLTVESSQMPLAGF